MIKSKKSLGQNFLIDKNICKKIANITTIANNNILEIGPGTGNLTNEIIKKKPKKLILIEKDKKLYLLLQEKYKNYKNIEIYNIDALKFNFEIYKDKFKIISNLPYNISTVLIFKILKLNLNISEMILMIQKEVAEKMIYKNNSKRNRLNSFIKIATKYKIEFNVSNKVFYPRPKINSSVIRIIPKKNLNINLYNFENFTRLFFNFKRKKIIFFFKRSNIPLDKINKTLLDKRAEDLKFDEILLIFKKYYNY